MHLIDRRNMLLRIALSVLTLSLPLWAGSVAMAQKKIHTETIKPPVADNPAAATSTEADGHVVAPGQGTAAHPPIITDLAQLPPAVARTRERILAAARSGSLQKLAAAMQTNGRMPVFSFSDDTGAVEYWRSNYPDSDGIEVLSILVSILEAGFVHVDVGTPQEIYLWPYFARMPLKTLTPQQKVELFRIVTGADYKDMLDFGAYSFYRLGISPDGTLRFFVAGD